MDQSTWHHTSPRKKQRGREINTFEKLSWHGDIPDAACAVPSPLLKFSVSRLSVTPLLPNKKKGWSQTSFPLHPQTIIFCQHANDQSITSCHSTQRTGMRQVEIQLIIAKMFSLYLPYFDKKWFMSAERSLKTRQHLPFFFLYNQLCWQVNLWRLN